MAKQKPEAPGTIWPTCDLKVIDDTAEPARWKTVGRCIDTPVAIAREMRRLKLAHAWVFHVYGKEYW